MDFTFFDIDSIRIQVEGGDFTLMNNSAGRSGYEWILNMLARAE